MNSSGDGDRGEAEALVQAARALGATIRAHRDETERLRRTPPALVKALAEAGLFKLWLPRALGGVEADPETFVRVVEEVSAADGATGWNVSIGAGYSVIAGYLREPVAREIFSDPYAVVAGQIGPQGKAIATSGGYRVRGRWSFGSGIHHSTWVVSGCSVFDGDTQRVNSKGVAHRLLMMTPVSEVRIDDNWHVSGLRGTGSCDYALEDVFVPEERAFLLFGKSQQPGPLYALPTALYSYPIAAVPLGIARTAIDALVEIAASKHPSGATAPLRELATAQIAVARADTMLRAARARLFETIDDLWQTACAGREVTPLQRANVRAASVYTAEQCAGAVDLVWKASGATSIQESSVIERCFRDIHAATQHFAVNERLLEDAGRVLFGLEPKSPVF